MKGILGRKIGMTQVFAKNGKLTPVTVIEVEPNVVSQIKTVATDGYDAIQLAAVEKREKLANKPEIGHLKKANTTPKRFLKEIRGVNVSDYSLGQVIKADLFEEGEMVSKVLLNVITNLVDQWDMVANITEVLVLWVHYFQCV